MSCYLSSGKGSLSFCVNTDQREERPLILDPLMPVRLVGKFDLLGRPLDAKQALEQVGQAELKLKLLGFLDANSILIGFLLPLVVPLVHYGLKLVGLLHAKFLLYADLHRILMGPFWRRFFRLPVGSATHHPSYALYVYCCDLLCVSSPETEEFFHPDNYQTFVRLTELLNPLGFKIVDEEVLKKSDDEADKSQGIYLRSSAYEQEDGEIVAEEEYDNEEQLVDLFYDEEGENYDLAGR